MSYTCSMITIFFPKKKRFVFVFHHYYYKKVVNYPNFLSVCVFFSSENVFLGISLVWSDRFHCLDVRRLSLDVRRLRKERLARFSICLHNKRGFDHVESERTFYTYIQSIAICFKFDPLLHSSRLDITVSHSTMSRIMIAPPPSLQQYTHIYTHNKYSWGSPVFQIHGLLIYVQPLYKTCVKGKKRIKFLWHLKMSFVCPVDF